MPNERRPPDPARQAQQHLASLRAAGVEWLSAKPETPAPPPPAEAPAAETPQPPPALFTDEMPASPQLTVEQRRQALTVLRQKVAGCTRCSELVANRRQTVFGVGSLDAELCFIGEAPGAEEDRRGEPFVGAAGQLLDRIIAACGMKREEVFICNVLRCRPPGNRDPLPNEVVNCREYLDGTLELVRPKFICALGRPAAQTLLGTTVGINKLRGRWFEYRGIPVMCTFHPAYLLRRPEDKVYVWEDMKKLLARMGRPIPKSGGNS